MISKRDRRTYYSEVVENIYKKINRLEKRIAKAEKIGAHKKNNKWHDEYVKVCQDLEKQLEYLDEYSGKLDKLG